MRCSSVVARTTSSLPTGRIRITASTLIAGGLFDRLSLWMFPILLGTGKHVFGEGVVPTNLTLVEPAITSPSGAVLVRYARADGVPTTGDMTRPDRGSATHRAP